MKKRSCSGRYEVEVKKFVSEVLNPETFSEIQENKIAIISGVGSGKNYFVENFLIQFGYVLCVSSRRAKVNEILLRDICEERISWDNFDNPLIATTNYGIELFAKSEKFSVNRKKVIEHFDYFVIDEAHSLCADATYADSSFYVNAFLEYVSGNYPEKKIILMTGTPEPITCMLKDYKVYDLREKCINVVPARIQLISKKDVFDIIGSLPENEKTIYMGNSAKGLVSGKFFEQMCEIVPADEMAFCMSEGAAKKNTKYFLGLEETVAATKEQLLDNNCLADETKVLLTTTTLKEGVNVKDESVKVAFCESVVLSDIQQFAGRVRNGLEVLYVVHDAKQHDVSDERMKEANMLMFLYICKQGNLLARTNEFFKEYILKEDSWLYKFSDNERPDEFLNEYFQSVMAGETSIYVYGGASIQRYIKLIQNQFGYIMFNYFTDCFEVNYLKYIEEKRIHDLFKSMKWQKQLEAFCKEYSIEFETLDSVNESVTKELEMLLESVAEKTLFEDEKTEFIEYITCLMNISGDSKIKTLNGYLRDCGIESYRIESCKTSRNGKSLRGIRIKKYDMNENVKLE